MIKACIFDLDGTVLYTLESIALAGNRMLAELGVKEQPLDDYRYFCGDGSDNLVIRCLKAADALTEERLARGKVLNRTFLAEKPSYHVRPYEGIREVLTALKERGLKLAIVSNKPDEAAQIAVRDAFGDLFDHIQGQGSGIPIKPDPTGALRTAEHFAVDPSECYYFGDTWTDMQTGRNAGMHTIGVLWGYRDRKELEENGAETVLSKPEEILELEF